MASYVEYVTARTLEEAYALNQKRTTVIVAGNMWLRLCGLKKRAALDLSLLGLDEIRETEDAFEIGAMTTLRRMETDDALNAAFGGAFSRALAPIVGTQLRNAATVGGSVYSRFGFSDVSALLLALGADVLTYARGAVPLEAYQRETPDRDIVLGVRVPKGRVAAVESVRVGATDIPTLVCAASLGEAGLRVALGARPGRALLAADGLATDAGRAEFERIAQDVPFGTNRRASAEYRRRVAPALMARAAAACRLAMREGGRA